MITTVAFDADETLVDTRAAVTSALEAVVAVLEEPALTVEVFQRDAAHYWKTVSHLPAQEIRSAALRHTLGRAGRGDDHQRMIDLFFEVRFANSRPFPDVLEVLGELKSEYRLGYATNANSEANLCGLAGQFAFEIYALRGGVPKKPAAGFYAAVATAAGAQPGEVVYVGDSYAHDIVGPAQFGMRTVWLNAKGLEAPGPVQPDETISSIAELPHALARIGCVSTGQTI